jgi:Tfp pilus assembly PilM family ATPase
MSKTAVGIYITSKNVDIIELAGSRSYPVLLNFARQEIPPASSTLNEAVRDSKDNQQDAVAVAIREGLDRLRIKAQSVQSVLLSNDVMIRYFNMPALPRSEQPRAIRFEAKKYVPFKLDDIVSDFQVSPLSKGKKSMDVFFISATKERLNAHIGKFTIAGVTATGIDIIPFALFRMLLLNKKASAKDILAILYTDSDKESVSIHIMESGMPFMSREIKVMIDDKDALFEKIASELRVSIDYYHRQKASYSVSKIILCGEPLLTGLDTYIADELKIITDTLYDFPKVKNADKAASSAIIAIGTALQGFGKSNYSVNLSPFHAVMQKKQALNVIKIEAVAVALIILLTYLSANLLLRGLKLQWRQLEKEAWALPESTSLMNVTKLTERKEAMIEGLKFIQLVHDNRTSVANKLSAIGQIIGKQRDASRGVWLNNLSFRETFITGASRLPQDIAREVLMSGSSFSPGGSKETEYINSFFEALKADEGFMSHLKDIELGSIERNNTSGQWVASFTISTYLQRMPDTTVQRDRG